MQRFSLQAPLTRNFVSEWAFHENLIRENILTTRYDFVNVIINGDHKGVYAFEESFTEDLLESQERREGIIVRYNEDLMWTDWVNVGHFPEIGHFWLTEGFDKSEIIPFRGTHISRAPELTEELIAATELLYSLEHGLIPISEVLDEELWGRYYAITDLWAAGHATIWHNQRFYYNPVSGLLEPIAFDGLALPLRYQNNILADLFSHEPFFNTPGVQKAYIKTLERITTPEYIAMLRN